MTVVAAVRRAFLDGYLHSRNAVEFHAFAPLEANMRVTNGIPLGLSLSYYLKL
jgi:hypothetical protein